jgi:hypothetical protein
LVMVFELEAERSTRNQLGKRVTARQRDEPGGHCLSEIKTPLPEVTPDRRPILIAARQLCPQLPLFGLGWRFRRQNLALGAFGWENVSA